MPLVDHCDLWYAGMTARVRWGEGLVAPPTKVLAPPILTKKRRRRRDVEEGD